MCGNPVNVVVQAASQKSIGHVLDRNVSSRFTLAGPPSQRKPRGGVECEV